MYRIGKTFSFEAAHVLHEHDGQCARLHGHSYKVEVAVSCPVLAPDGPKAGMVMDFAQLSEAVDKAVVQPNDHSGNPITVTAELLARKFFERLVLLLPLHIKLDFVKVWETEKAYAEYWRH